MFFPTPVSNFSDFFRFEHCIERNVLEKGSRSIKERESNNFLYKGVMQIHHTPSLMIYTKLVQKIHLNVILKLKTEKKNIFKVFGEKIGNKSNWRNL